MGKSNSQKVAKTLKGVYTKIRKNLFHLPFSTMKRIAQINNSSCGPAVVEMLFSYLGFAATQRQIIKAAGIVAKIKKYGMTVSEMGKAVKKLSQKSFVLWYRKDTTFNQLSEIVNKHGYPVGIEWQGVFGKYEYGDNGHYSVCVFVGKDNKKITLVDPFKYFVGEDRIFEFEEFKKRWWDQNMVKKGSKRVAETERYVSFIITPKETKFPKNLGMKKA